jgi:hypothetical protein
MRTAGGGIGRPVDMVVDSDVLQLEDWPPSNQLRLPTQTKVFEVDPVGTNQVIWVQGSGTWQGPLAI